MQSRGAIKFFAIVFSLVCLYQLSFTWIASNVENDAKEFAAGDVLKEKIYLDSMLSEPVYNLLVKNYTYKEVKEREINLGLDLQGGMNVTLEVSLVELVKNMSNNSADPVFNTAINNAREMQKSAQEDFVTLFGKAFNQLDPSGKQLSSPAIFGTIALKNKITPYESSNEDVLAVIKAEAEDAVERSMKIIRTRVDKFGVTSPSIQRVGTTGRIFVELPGVKDEDRVIKLLKGTAKLEFWETYDNTEIFGYLSKANSVIKALETQKDTTVVDSSTTNTASTVISPPDSALAAIDTTKNTLLDQLAEDTSALAGEGQDFEKFAKENPLFAVMRPSVYQGQDKNIYPGQGPVVGMAAIKDTAKVNSYLALKNVKALFPFRVKFLWTAKPVDEKETVLQLIAIKVADREGKAPLEGDAIADARQDFNNVTGKVEISMNMNHEGAIAWKNLTGKNIGKSIAIVLDDHVYSFPTVQGEIAGGSSQITGNFEVSEAQDLALLLKAGKLPAPSKIVENTIVGPSLGESSVKSGLLSFGLALVLVIIYMAFWYGIAGWVANIALLANLFFILGVLASINAVLTLPGIAGIVLIIGMSVDANVLIYERIREELSAGKGLKLAIDDGYKHAYSSIIDANVTSLLTGIILYVFGTGPIKGFATTLVIGILTSMFAAIFITRLIFLARLEKNKPINFITKATENAFKNTNIDFVGKRKKYYLTSGLIILAGVISMATNGFNWGVDFTGGHSYVVKFEEKVNTLDVREALTKAFGDAPEVKTFGGASQVKITTKYLIDDDSDNVDEMVKSKLTEGLNAFAGEKHELMSSQKVGPTIADDIKASAVWAILFSLLVIFIYIIIRFKKWQFGLGALAALFHDVLVVLSLFSMLYRWMPFTMEIDQAFIAAILTVIGYSINDTVVVFDRIREYLGDYKKRDAKTVINNALNSTISRTFNTSVTVFVVLVAIFFFGGEVIRGFSFALLIGVVVGTYSSICIATPLVIDLSNEEKLLEEPEKKKENVSA